jgi:hypothetical protein
VAVDAGSRHIFVLFPIFGRISTAYHPMATDGGTRWHEVVEHAGTNGKVHEDQLLTLKMKISLQRSSLNRRQEGPKAKKTVPIRSTNGVTV